MNRLEGKSALVTGGSRGIGRAIVDAFLREGAKVMTCGRGERPQNLDAAVLWERADVSSPDDVRRMQVATLEKLGKIDIVVNNAGIQVEKTVVDTTDEEWDALMGINAKGVFLVCREFIPAMTPGGSIVNIGSYAGKVADFGLGIYNASKAFVHGLTRSIAVDHGPGVRCNAICPGWIMTEMADDAFALADDPDAAKSDALIRHPAGRFGEPEDIASMAVWLASDESGFATGQCYTLDGGLSAGSALKPDLF